MVHGHQGEHHLHKRKRLSNKRDWIKALDKIVIATGIIGPLMTIPQLYNIWIIQNPTGVSAISWTAYLLIAIVWLIYGFAHKAKPIIMTYIIWIFLDILIIIGTLLYG